MSVSESEDKDSLDIEVDPSDLKEEAMARILRQMMSRKRAINKPGGAAKKAAESDDDDEDSEQKENNDLVNLARESRGDDKAPAVLESDLPADVIAAMKAKRSSDGKKS